MERDQTVEESVDFFLLYTILIKFVSCFLITDSRLTPFTHSFIACVHHTNGTLISIQFVSIIRPPDSIRHFLSLSRNLFISPFLSLSLTLSISVSSSYFRRASYPVCWGGGGVEGGTEANGEAKENDKKAK